MKDVMELLYEESERWCAGMQEGNMELEGLTNDKGAAFDRLMESMNPAQKDLFDLYFQLEGRITKILNYDSFRFAFHLGVQIAEEQTRGREDLLRKIEKNL